MDDIGNEQTILCNLTNSEEILSEAEYEADEISDNNNVKGDQSHAEREKAVYSPTIQNRKQSVNNGED